MQLFDKRWWYLRSAKLVAVTSGGSVVLVHEHSGVLKIPTTNPAQWSRMLQYLTKPISGTALGELWRSTEASDDLCQRLIADGYLLRTVNEEELRLTQNRVFSDNQGFDFTSGPSVCGHLVLACTGSVVAGLVAPTVLSLAYSGFQSNLDVVLSATAQKFVTRDLFESYGITTWTDPFERHGDYSVPHVQLARSADCVLVLPATADAMHRLAHGACSDLLSLIASVTEAAIILVPAMNDAMWNNRAIQRNVRQLREDGMFIIEPTLIFGAADLSTQGEAMFGGHGTLWAGPRLLKRAIAAVVASD